MITSRAEMAALLMKAARGAGLPLGLAEDLYVAADYATSDDIAVMATDIRSGGGQLQALTDALDRVAAGETLSHTPPLAHVLAATRGWAITDEGLQRTPPDKRHGPLDVAEDILAALQSLAAKTYVPETAASRAKGAGAGEIDND